MLKSELILGYLLLFLASVIFSVMSVLVRVLGTGGAYQALVVRFAVGIAVVVALWVGGWIRIKPVNWRLLAVRGVTGGAAVWCYFLAIGHVGLAEGSVLSFAFPIFTAICARLFLGERQSFGAWAAVAVSFSGVYLVVWPESWSGPLAYKLLALGGAVLAGIAVASIRQLRRTDSSYTIFLSQCTFGLAIVAVPAASSSFAFGVRAWFLLLGVGLFATVGQLMMTSAFKHVRATQGSIFSFITPVINVLFGACLFHEAIPARSWLGSCLVIGACIYVSLADTQGHSPEGATHVVV